MVVRTLPDIGVLTHGYSRVVATARGSLPTPSTVNTWNLTLGEPTLATRIFFIDPQAAGNGVLVRRACAYSTATPQDAMRERTESAREVRTMGTRAPSTIPAASALERNIKFLASMLPASKSGTTRICACPATADLMPLISAACGLMALSKASGPSRIPPVIWPRSAILQSAAASIVDGILGVTVSTA